MDDSLKLESERLARSWMQHEPEWLRDYLVRDVEDPRINLQSIFSRHFLIRALFGEQFDWLMEQEIRFSAVMNWLLPLIRGFSGDEEVDAVSHALKSGADNAEGMTIPGFVPQTFSSLPATASQTLIPNYIEVFLAGTQFLDGQAKFDQSSLDVFARAWREVLGRDPVRVVAAALPLPASAPSVASSEDGRDERGEGGGEGFLERPREEEGSDLANRASAPISVLEPACGSANDYRFLDAYGMAEWLDYTGLDICLKNIENARGLFPGVRFETGNVFDLACPDKAFDLCFVHDLFEHLSPGGLVRAVGEVCRATRLGICAGFFSMDEIPEHIVRPVDEYHWNTLSLPRVRELFARQGFSARVIHVASFLRQRFGCAQTYNKNAYTIICWRTAANRMESRL